MTSFSVTFDILTDRRVQNHDCNHRRVDGTGTMVLPAHQPTRAIIGGASPTGPSARKKNGVSNISGSDHGKDCGAGYNGKVQGAQPAVAGENRVALQCVVTALLIGKAEPKVKVGQTVNQIRME